MGVRLFYLVEGLTQNKTMFGGNRALTAMNKEMRPNRQDFLTAGGRCESA